VKLSKEERQIAIDLWNDVINPKCLEFAEQTGKPADAMREAITGVIARRTNQPGAWNAWQKYWWKTHPKANDEEDWSGKSVTFHTCPLE